MAANDQSDDRFTGEVCSEIDATLASNIGSLSKWNSILKVLKEANISYQVTCKPSELFVHPKNRSGMGLNAFNVHRNLAVISTIGADKEALQKATAFEMWPEGAKRAEALAFNEGLVKQEAGSWHNPQVMNAC